MRLLRFMLLVWLGVTIAGALATISPLWLRGLQVLLGFGMLVHNVPFGVLVSSAAAFHILAFCYIWRFRPV